MMFTLILKSEAEATEKKFGGITVHKRHAILVDDITKEIKEDKDVLVTEVEDPGQKPHSVNKKTREDK